MTGRHRAAFPPSGRPGLSQARTPRSQFPQMSASARDLTPSACIAPCARISHPTSRNARRPRRPQRPGKALPCQVRRETRCAGDFSRSGHGQPRCLNARKVTMRPGGASPADMGARREFILRHAASRTSTARSAASHTLHPVLQKGTSRTQPRRGGSDRQASRCRSVEDAPAMPAAGN